MVNQAFALTENLLGTEDHSRCHGRPRGKEKWNLTLKRLAIPKATSHEYKITQQSKHV